MKKVFRSPAFTGLLFLLALGLLLAGTIGGTRAALTIQSDIMPFSTTALWGGSST